MSIVQRFLLVTLVLLLLADIHVFAVVLRRLMLPLFRLFGFANFGFLRWSLFNLALRFLFRFGFAATGAAATSLA